MIKGNETEGRLPRYAIKAYNENMDRVIETTCRSAIYRHNSKWLPFKHDINVYRGCAHRCIYCYALYSHAYIDGGDFFGDVYAKTNIADMLRRELPRFSREAVNLGGITDSYQPAERTCKLMPEVLALLAKYAVPIVLCTKSALVLRDLELISQVNAASGAALALTVTTLNKGVADIIEPGSSRPQERMAAIPEIKKTGATCGVHLMPIIPYLTSGEESLEAVFAAAKEAGADYVLTGSLNLKTATKKQFFESVKKGFSSEYNALQDLYSDRNAYMAYKEKLGETITKLRRKYDMPSYVMPKVKEQPT